MAIVFDCFSFFNELDVLEIRLAELWNVVDHFVLVESITTHSGRTKPLYFAEHRARFAPFADKIIHVIVKDMPDGEGHDANWARERHQRDSIYRGISDAAPEDRIIVSDVDEIPKPAILAELLKQNPSARNLFKFVCDQYCLCLNLRTTRQHWLYLGPVMVTRSNFRSGTALRAFWPRTVSWRFPPPLLTAWDAVRMRRKLGFWGLVNIVSSGAWHFSFLGDDQLFRDKLSSYAHQELNTPELNEQADDLVANALRYDKFLGREGWGFQIDSIDRLPYVVRKDPMRFGHLLADQARL